MEFNFNIKALKWFGIFVPNLSKVPFLRVFWSFFVLFTMSCVGVFSYSINQDDIISKVWTAFYVNTVISGYGRWFFFALQKKKMTDLIALIENSHVSESEEFDCLEAEMRERSRRKIKVFSAGLFVYQIASFQTVLWQTLIRMIRTLVESFDTSFDGTSSQPFMSPLGWTSALQKVPTYYFIIMWQFFVFVICNGTAVTTDSFTCSLILAARQRSSFLVRTAPMALLPGPDGEVTPQFRAWVNYHQHYLRIVNTINEVMGPFMFFVQTSTCFYIIMYSFSLVKVDDNSTKTIAVFTMTGMLIRIFVYAVVGQKLLDQSVQLRQSVVHVSQVTRGGLQHAPFRSCLQVLVTRLSGGAPPEEVSGLGFFTVNLEFFCTVLNACFSYLMILLSFK